MDGIRNIEGDLNQAGELGKPSWKRRILNFEKEQALSRYKVKEWAKGISWLDNMILLYL